jgi:hypothetical protein
VSYEAGLSALGCGAESFRTVLRGLVVADGTSSNGQANLLHRAATDVAFLDLAGAPVNDFVPLRFRVSVHGVSEAGDARKLHLPSFGLVNFRAGA